MLSRARIDCGMTPPRRLRRVATSRRCSTLKMWPRTVCWPPRHPSRSWRGCTSVFSAGTAPRPPTASSSQATPHSEGSSSQTSSTPRRTRCVTTLARARLHRAPCTVHSAHAHARSRACTRTRVGSCTPTNVVPAHSRFLPLSARLPPVFRHAASTNITQASTTHSFTHACTRARTRMHAYPYAHPGLRTHGPARAYTIRSAVPKR